jgi:hypothetical protein
MVVLVVTMVLSYLSAACVRGEELETRFEWWGLIPTG